MKITQIVIRVSNTQPETIEKNTLVAIASINLNHCLWLNQIKLIQSNTQRFILFPFYYSINNNHTEKIRKNYYNILNTQHKETIRKICFQHYAAALKAQETHYVTQEEIEIC